MPLKKILDNERPNSSTIRSWVALIIAIAALTLSVQSNFNILTTQPAPQSLFAAPQDLERTIQEIKRSLVTLKCGEFLGSGWVIETDWSEIEDPNALVLIEDFPSAVVTNYHVIEDCASDDLLQRRAVIGATGLEKEYVLWDWDEKNDLALVLVDSELRPLPQSLDNPAPGWWTMAIGSPWEFNSSVSIGNLVSNDSSVTDFDLITTAILNPGNSGGPLVNSRGEVIGTNTWSVNDPEFGLYNIATNNAALCVLFKCPSNS